MDTPLAPEDGSDIDVLQSASQTFRQMAEVAQKMDMDSQEVIFYNHLVFHCVRLETLIQQARQVSLRLDGDVINRALSHLSSLILGIEFQQLSHDTSLKLRLQDLNVHWGIVGKSDDKAQAELVARWVQLRLSKDHLDRMDRELEECGDILEKQQRRQRYFSNRLELQKGRKPEGC